MVLNNKIYYIINTPVVDGQSVYTYNVSPTNTLSLTGTSYIYYADIVTAQTFKVNSDLNSPNSAIIVTGISINAISQIPSATPTNNYLLSKTPIDIYELSKLISITLLNFTDNIQLLNKCVNNAKFASTSECNDTFQSPISLNPISLYQYSAMNTTYRRKHLQQQANDLKNLMTTYNTILQSLKQTANALTPDQYGEIITMYDKNLLLRNELDQKLGEIYQYNDSKFIQSQYTLDKTVYSNVLLTILATSMIYIVFTKL
jgi:hypothetical protein